MARLAHICIELDSRTILGGQIWSSLNWLLTLDNVGSHECGRVVIALKIPSGKVSLDLKGEKVSCVLLLKLAGVGDVKLDGEAEKRFP